MRNNNIIALLLATAVVLSVASCRKMEHNINNPDISEGPFIDTTYVGQFRQIWQGIDVGYAFWHTDPVDWDSVYRVNISKFEAADKRVKSGQEGMSIEDYLLTWDGIISPLLDHHLNLYLFRPEEDVFDIRHLVHVTPATMRMYSEDWHRRFTKEEHLATVNSMIKDSTLKADLKEKDFPVPSEPSAYMISGMIEGNIAYLYISSFMIPCSDTSAAYFVGNWISNIIENKNLKGAILDTRNNGGGYESWTDFLGQYFCDKRFSSSYKKVKTDIGRCDYSAGIYKYIEPNANGNYRIMSEDCPFVCLFDQNSVSNGEEIPWMFSHLSGYVGIGERTAGGMGGLLLNNYTSFFSGTFGNANLLKGDYSKNQYVNFYCYMSTFAHFDSETGKCPEGIGMIPNVEVLLDTDAFFSGKSDNQLLKAVEFIKSK